MTRMSFYCLILCVFLAPNRVRAVVIAEESFDYPTDKVLTGTDGGQGWDGPWFTSPLNKTDNRVVAASVLVPKARGNYLRLNGDDVRNFRRIDTKRPEFARMLEGGPNGRGFGKPGTTVWCGFLIAVEGNRLAHGGIHLCDGVGDLSKDIFGDKRAHQRIQLGRNNLLEHWILCRVTAGGPGAGKWESTVKADSTVRLLVYRFDFARESCDGYLFIDPQSDNEPNRDTAAIKAHEMTPFHFNTINVGSGGGAKYMLDEIRIGTEFKDVLPPQP